LDEGGSPFARFWDTIVFARTAKNFCKHNIYFDISATVTLVAGSPIEPEFVWTIGNIGVDHIMLGSDYPQFTLRQTVDALETSISTAVKRTVFSTRLRASF